MKILTSLMLYLTVMFIAGCADKLKSEYHAPIINYPGNWVKGAPDENTAPFDWKKFNDPQLDNWLRQVMSDNINVSQAVLRLYRAKLDEEMAGISNIPTLSGALNLQSQTQRDDVSHWTKHSGANLSTVYELDLWGKIARQRDLAVWDRLSIKEDLRFARLKLLSEASMNYWQIGFVNQQIKARQQNLDHVRNTLRLVKARYRAGAVTSEDVSKTRQTLLLQENALTTLQRERLLLLNHQAVLRGVPPGKPFVEPQTLPEGTLPHIRADIPASVLMHRPDIKAKEWRLREALTLVDIRRTDFYPSFRLTGGLGSGSTSLVNLLQNPVASIGAGLTLPFLEWQKLSMNIRIAKNDYEQRLLDFKAALFEAMSEIQGELLQHNQLLAQDARLREVLSLERQAEHLYEVRYREGAISISDWLDAQEKRREAELSLHENTYQQFCNLARIYLAFGGEATFS